MNSEADAPVRGRRLGVDVGTVRIGVAVSDPDCVMATPLETLARDASKSAKVPSDVARLAQIVDEYEIVEIVIGLPVTLRGEESFAAAEVRAYAERVSREMSPMPVRLTDERLTTAAASRKLTQRGVRGRRQRAVVDQMAAVEILQHWLDQRKAQGSR
ncbi:MAG: Holliday junction resolvase RuvX [Stackebrandtia sp.]